MAKLLYITTKGIEDPTHATLPFMLAKGALDAGHEPTIILLTEATLLMYDPLIDNVQGLGFPSLRELIDALKAANVPVYVCGTCAKARNISADAFAGQDVYFQLPFSNSPTIANLVAEADQVVTF